MAVSIATAGATGGVPTGFGADTAIAVAKNAAVKSVINSAVYETNLGESFVDNLAFQAALSLGGTGANYIGNQNLNIFESAALHAALGCGIGAVAGDCGAGAIGGAVGELGADLSYNTGLLSKDAAAQFGQYTALGTSLVTGSDANGIYATNYAAINSIYNNWYDHVVNSSGYQLPNTTIPGTSNATNITSKYTNILTGEKIEINQNNFTFGSLGDIGASYGISGHPKYSGDTTFNFGVGRFLGVQITPSSSQTVTDNVPWYDVQRYINTISIGIGAGVAAPITPTISSDNKKNGNK